MTILFYPAKVYPGKKGYPYNPEHITGRAMLNAKYRINNFTTDFKAICDSGAFQDREVHKRLELSAAFERQLKYREQIRTILNNPIWDYECMCIYDQMIMNQNIDGGKHAIEQTLSAAEYYNSRKSETQSLMYIAHGFNTQQYIDDCVIPLLSYFDPEKDIFGLGEFAITGKNKKKRMPFFLEILDTVLPILHNYGVKRIHLLGVALPEAIRIYNDYCIEYQFIGSTDSSGPEINALAFGKLYTDNLKAIATPGKPWIDYNPIDLAHNNVTKYNNWISSF